MYSYLKGEIVEISAKNIVLEVNDIGYEVYVSNPYSYDINSNMLVYTYQKVSEDDISLYGFKTKSEKKMFLDLISVKGIGAKTALVILEVTTVENLKMAIVKKEVNYLMKFPKIGKKSAQQIILDLENKFKNNIEINEKFDEKLIKENEEVVEAMIALGYDDKRVRKVLEQVDQSLNQEKKIKECLKLLTK